MEYLVVGLYILNGIALHQILRIIRLQKERITEGEKFKEDILKAKYIDIGRATEPLLQHISRLENIIGKKDELLDKDSVLSSITALQTQITQFKEKLMTMDDYYSGIPIVSDE